MPLTTAEANALLNASMVKTAYPNNTATKLGLVSVVGSATAAGTEVSGGSGPYARQACTFSGGATSGAITNDATVTFTGMPAVTVAGFELWDSAATPNRKWFGNLTPSKALAAGDSITFPAGSIQLGLS